jgi:hypothetical protein
MHDERFFYNENLRAVWRVWMPTTPSVTTTPTTKAAIKGLCRKTRAITQLLRGRTGRRPITTHLYHSHKEFIWTTWSRLNFEAAKGSGYQAWVSKHVAMFRMGLRLSRRHFVDSHEADEPPDLSHLTARMLSAMFRISDTYVSELKRISGILSIHSGEHSSENQCRYTPRELAVSN